MTAATLPLQLLLLTVSGWVHRHQQDVIAYLVEENRVLKEQLGGRKLQLTNDQRRRLAAKAKLLGRRALDAVATLVTPDTLMRWHRRLIAWKWTYMARRVGRPGLRQAISDLIVRMARENERWGYCRIQGELRKLGHRVAASTIGKVLKDHGIRPAPDRPTSWRTFLRAHWGEVAGMDFFTTEVWTPLGLTTYYLLFLIDLKTRRAHVAGLTTTPDGVFMAQVARNLTDPEDGFLRTHRVVICDRDVKFTAEFRHILQAVGVRVIRTPRQAPNCNAHAERFVLSIKSECLNRMMFFGEASLRRAVGEYLQHYHRERPHQGRGNETLDLARRSTEGALRCRERLGGLPQTLRESGVTMGAINRSAVIIRPLPPYLAWAKRDDTTDIAKAPEIVEKFLFGGPKGKGLLRWWSTIGAHELFFTSNEKTGPAQSLFKRSSIHVLSDRFTQSVEHRWGDVEQAGALESTWAHVRTLHDDDTWWRRLGIRGSPARVVIVVTAVPAEAVVRTQS